MEQFWDKVEGTGYLKAGLLGFPKSGKTFTGILLAVAAKRKLGATGPIAFFDTEGGSTYIEQLVMDLTGEKVLVKRSRSFDDLMAFAAQLGPAGVSVAIVDSITHPWRELTEAYLVQKNEARKAQNKAPVKRLEFQDWNVIKPTWDKWTQFYLNSPNHIVICGRAGFEYDFETKDDGTKELIKTGVKMKTEGEFGFEPSLLIEMEREQDREGDTPRIIRRATVLGDRFGIIDGQTFTFDSLPGKPEEALEAVSAAFGPHLAMLKKGVSAPVDSTLKTDFGIGEDGDAEWTAERRERTILCEEIEGAIVSAYPGQSKEEKKAKVDILETAFNTRSWEKIKRMDATQLRRGLADIRAIVSKTNTGPIAVEEKEMANG